MITVSPFVLGIIKPKIYLPFRIDEQNMEHVIAHEQAHIRRKDHLWKLLGFLILTLHWFNPFMWLGYILFCRDIEFACDEKVIKALNTEQRADYSQALLTCSVNRRIIAACPLAFGEAGVKDRVKTVLNYKKPAFWIIVVSIIVSIVAAVCFLTNPAKDAGIFAVTDGHAAHDKGDTTAIEPMVGDIHSAVQNNDNVTSFESTVSYANWSEASEIILGALNREKMIISSVHHLPVYKFDTLNDLESFKQSFGSIFSMNSGMDEVPSFNDATAKYDSAFFEENSLILVYVSANNCTHRFKVHGVGYDDKSFCVHITETTNAKSVDTAMAGWFVTVAVSDERIKGYTEFDADLNKDNRAQASAYLNKLKEASP